MKDTDIEDRLNDALKDNVASTSTSNQHNNHTDNKEYRNDEPAILRSAAAAQLAAAAAAAEAAKKNNKKRLRSEHSLTEDTDGGNGLAEAVAKKRPRRTWELWSNDDKHIFFSALNEYGKDFDKIQEYFKSKMKNKQNVPAEFIKNKNQIRHFYYRTWHKISVYINFDTELKTSTKELFGLINYGELWKKIGGNLSDKVGLKLDELVQRGSVTIKHKGKTLRVKTPVCPVLKQIHNKPDKAKNKDELLPTRVTIELKPRHTSDWIRVHKMAQNPVIKVTMGLQRKLASLLKCLKSKWRCREQKLLENLQSRGEAGATNISSSYQDYDLILVPARGSEKRLPVIIPLPTITSEQISLQSMKEESTTTITSNISSQLPLIPPKEGVNGGSSNNALSNQPTVINSKPKLKLKFDRDGVGGMVVSEANGNGFGDDETTNGSGGPCADTDNCDKSVESNNPFYMHNTDDPHGDDVDIFIPDDSEGENSQSPVPPACTNSNPSSENDIYNNGEFPDCQDETDGGEKLKKDGTGNKDKDLKTNLSNLAGFDPRQGWCLDNCGEITIGEIFLMLAEGKESCFGLEYEWRQRTVKIEEKPAITTNTNTLVSQEVETKDTKPDCIGVLGKLLKLTSSQSLKVGRGRHNSLSASSPSVRVSAASSPTTPTGGTASRSSPVSRGIQMAAGRGGGVAKQLMSEGNAEKQQSQDGPLAVPIEQQESATSEFRKPLAPAPGPAVKPAPINSVFHQQIGQYFPKFSNRRGRQNRSRMNNKFVGRQVLKPIPPPIQPVPTISVVSTTLTTNPNIIITPSPYIISSRPGGTATLVLAPQTATLQPITVAANQVNHQPPQHTMTPKSPPQISIPSPAMSPSHHHNTDTLSSAALLSAVPHGITALSHSPSPQPPRTPSPTPSLSSLMDLSFSESTSTTSMQTNKHHDTPPEPFLSMIEDTSLLNTPIRVSSPPSSDVNLSEDISLTPWGLSFDSPLKQGSILNHNDDSQTSIISTNSEVDRQLTAMMNENSIDFTSTFRQLAKHVTSSDKDGYHHHQS